MPNNIWIEKQLTQEDLIKSSSEALKQLRHSSVLRMENYERRERYYIEQIDAIKKIRKRVNKLLKTMDCQKNIKAFKEYIVCQKDDQKSYKKKLEIIKLNIEILFDNVVLINNYLKVTEAHKNVSK